jgi:hypothetical protein
LRNAIGPIRVLLAKNNAVLEIDVRRGVIAFIRIGVPIGGRDVLSAVVIEIRRFHHEIIRAERVELIGDEDAVTERIGGGDNRGVDGVGQQIGINDGFVRRRTADNQRRRNVEAIQVELDTVGRKGGAVRGNGESKSIGVLEWVCAVGIHPAQNRQIHRCFDQRVEVRQKVAPAGDF